MTIIEALRAALCEGACLREMTRNEEELREAGERIIADLAAKLDAGCIVHREPEPEYEAKAQVENAKDEPPLCANCGELEMMHNRMTMACPIMIQRLGGFHHADKYSKAVPCPRCAGRGMRGTTAKTSSRCPDCGGTGRKK